MNKNNSISLFAISFKQGFICPNVPIATFTQGNKKLNFLIDTGSDSNIINEQVIDTLEYTPVEDTNKHNLTGFGGKAEVHKCKIKFQCGDEEYDEIFLIADLTEAFGLMEQDHSIILHGILGSSFLKDNDIILNFKTLSAYNVNK